RCERVERVGDVLVDHRLEVRRAVFGEEHRHEEEQLRLPFVQIAHELHDEPQLALMTPDGNGRRKLALARRPRAGPGTRDLDEAFGATTDRTDLLTDSRTAAPRLSCSAKRANH